jgi:hypothetical protein
MSARGDSAWSVVTPPNPNPPPVVSSAAAMGKGRGREREEMPFMFAQRLPSLSRHCQEAGRAGGAGWSFLWLLHPEALLSRIHPHSASNTVAADCTSR